MPTSSYRGTGTRIGLGKEASFGSIQARANWHHFISGGIQEEHVFTPRPYLALAGSALIPTTDSPIETAIKVTGSLTVPLRYTGMGLLFEAILGTVAEGGGGGPSYTHTFTLTDPDSLPTLTLENIRGDSGYSEIFLGVCPTRAILSVSAMQLGTLQVDFIGEKASAARNTAGTPTDGDLNELIGHQAGTIGWNSLTLHAKSIRVEIDRALAAREFLGSKYTLQPRATGLGSVKVVATFDVNDSFYTAYLAGTKSDLTITITGTSPEVIAINAQNCMITAYSDPMKDQGIQEVEVEWTVYQDAALVTAPLTITVTNSDATYDVN
jgi:hypothetical protein